MFRNCRDTIRTAACNSKSNPNQAEEELVSCDICDKGWHSETDTFLHKEEHCSEIQSWITANHHVCLICVKRLKTRQSLIKHLKTVHLHSSPNAKRVERQIYVCNECSQIFFNKTILLIHLYKRHFRMHRSCKLQCMLCKKFGSLAKIWSHMKRAHPILGVSTCKICFVKCKNSNELQRHVETHPFHYSCEQCLHIFKSIDAFSRHIDLHDESSFEIKTLLSEDDSDTEKKEHLKRWTYPQVKVLNGTKLEGQLYVCILCRHICLDKNETRKHLVSHYTVLKTRGQTKPVNRQEMITCTCGQTFTSNILKKHHLFMNKDHYLKEVKLEMDEEVKPPAMSSPSTPAIDQLVPHMDAVLQRVFIH